MSTSEIKPGEGVKDVNFTEDALSVDLIDGRTIIVPLAWYPRLLHATPEQRNNWEICGGGYGLHWPSETTHTDFSLNPLVVHDLPMGMK